MKKLELELENNNYFLSKEVFEHPDLSIAEVRLLLVISTKKDLTLNKMDKNTKLWICKSCKYYSSLSKMEANLISKGLIKVDGTGKQLLAEGNFLLITDLSIIDNSKSVRQLFINSIDIWHTKREKVIVKVETFKGLFGDTVKLINHNIKAICKGDYNISWNNIRNSIHITKEEKSAKEIFPASILSMSNILSNISTRNTNEIPEPVRECNVEELERLVRESEFEAIPEPNTGYEYDFEGEDN